MDYGVAKIINRVDFVNYIIKGCQANISHRHQCNCSNDTALYATGVATLDTGGENAPDCKMPALFSFLTALGAVSIKCQREGQLQVCVRNYSIIFSSIFLLAFSGHIQRAIDLYYC